ncbi:MAG: phospho-sugar mutase [Flavobacteriales bacterium]|nr:phospho-sugar mutase [Flavobacteriales bacterium]
MSLDSQALIHADSWLNAPIDKADKLAIEALKTHDPDGFNESFYKLLEFGTGGMRGIMRLGSNGINRYTIGQATQGLANALKGPDKLSVAIACDCRINSQHFAETAANVLAANGIDVYLFDSLRPTPLLSFALREKGCDAGIVITASHNPKAYNGYKVYGKDGGQIVPPQDADILQSVRNVTIGDILWSGGQGRIHRLGEAMDQVYINMLESMQLTKARDLSVVFTSLHGTAITLLPEALKCFGFSQVHVLASQAEPDGNFPTVQSPNPEEAAALELAINKAHELGADLVIGCDPDADRVGIALMDHDGVIRIINGNQIASLLVNHVLSNSAKSQQLPDNAFTASTVVTTTLINHIAAKHQVKHVTTLTGFKWIAQQIQAMDDHTFIVGGEESYGYLIGDKVRDKDAIASACMIAEAAADAKSRGKNLLDDLMDLYCEHGLHHDHLLSVVKTGRRGEADIKGIMDRLRNQCPTNLAGIQVQSVTDYMHPDQTGLPASNVIQLHMSNGDRITARPSGTEPKIKYYFNTLGPALRQSHLREDYVSGKQALESRIASYEAIITAL